VDWVGQPSGDVMPTGGGVVDDWDEAVEPEHLGVTSGLCTSFSRSGAAMGIEVCDEDGNHAGGISEWDRDGDELLTALAARQRCLEWLFGVGWVPPVTSAAPSCWDHGGASGIVLAEGFPLLVGALLGSVGHA